MNLAAAACIAGILRWPTAGLELWACDALPLAAPDAGVAVVCDEVINAG